MTSSMTAFASQTGSEGGVSWVLEMRGVNAKGLDIRLRLPDRMSALEAPLRAKLAKRLARGNVGVTLRVEEASTGGTVRLDEDILEAYVNAAIRVRTIAKNKGLRLAEATAPDYLGLRGVVRSDGALSELPEAAILAGFDAALEDFVQMRAAEGRALAVILRDQLAQITALVTTAAQQAEARKGQVAATLKANLARVMDNTDGADADGGEGRRVRGDRPPCRPCRRDRSPVERRRPGGAETGFLDAGIQPRGEHLVLQGRRG